MWRCLPGRNGSLSFNPAQGKDGCKPVTEANRKPTETIPRRVLRLSFRKWGLSWLVARADTLAEPRLCRAAAFPRELGTGCLQSSPCPSSPRIPRSHRRCCHEPRPGGPLFPQQRKACEGGGCSPHPRSCSWVGSTAPHTHFPDTWGFSALASSEPQPSP